MSATDSITLNQRDQRLSLAPRRIFYLVDTLNIGGTERQMVQAAVRLRQAGHDVTVGALAAEGPLLRVLQGAGIRVIEFRKGKSFLSLNGIRQLVRLTCFIRRERFDVVHSHDLWSNLLGVPAAWLARTPIIISSRRYLADLDWYTPRRNKLVRLLYRLSTHIVVNSHSVRELLVTRDGITPEKICVIPNGVDLERFTNRECDRRDILPMFNRYQKLIAVVANMYSEVKGHKTLIAAARMVCSEFPSAKFLLIGDGCERSKLEQQVRAEGLEDYIHFLGQRADVPRLLGCCDLSVLPSEAEALPNSLMEAMAAGLPVIATQVGGNAEIVHEGTTGVLVPSKNPAALASAILHVLKNPELASQLGHAGRERIRNEYGLDRLIAQLEQLYAMPKSYSSADLKQAMAAASAVNFSQ